MTMPFPPNLRPKQGYGPKVNMPVRELPPDVRYVPNKDLFDLLRRRFREEGFEQAAIETAAGNPVVIAVLDEFESFCRKYLVANPVRSTGFNSGQITVFLTDGNQVPFADGGKPDEATEAQAFQIHQPPPDRKIGMASMPIDNTSIGISGDY